MVRVIVAAADGSSLSNPGPAGWAWFVDGDRWAAGGWKHATNNKAELMAVLDLLRQTRDAGDDLLVLCDSQYVINALTKWMPGWKRKGWKKADGKPVSNVEIMKALDEAMRGRRVRFEWVKGHAGHVLNEAADRRANAAAVAFRDGRAPEAGPGFGGADRSPRGPHGGVGSTQAGGGSAASAAPRSGSTRSDAPRSDAPRSDAPGSDAHRGEPQDDLFSLGQDEPSDEELVIALERSLLRDEVRADRASVSALLHPQWQEIGASGALWERDAMLEAIAPLRAPVSLDVVSVQALAPGVILLVWRSDGADGAALRSSLWQRVGQRWLQRFHQGTLQG